MPYQLLYLHGDPESTKLHLQLDKGVLFTGVLMPKKHPSKEIAVGYAFAMYDFPEVFINPVKAKSETKGDGYFAVLDVAQNKVIAVVTEQKEEKDAGCEA